MIHNEPFSSSVTYSGDAAFVRMAGIIDEHARLPEFTVAKVVNVNLGQVSSINSVGSRSWLGWLQRLRPPVRVYLEECPVVLVKSFNMVRGFLTPACEVKSFYVPYYSETTGERRDILAVRDRNFSRGPHVNLETPLDSRGERMELDVVESAYLAFLNQ